MSPPATPRRRDSTAVATHRVYQRAGIDLGGAYTVTQYSRAQHISRAQAKPGDLVFFYNYPTTSSAMWVSMRATE